MRYLRILAMGLLGGGALYGIFFASCIFGHVQFWQADLHTELPSWISTPVSLLSAAYEYELPVFFAFGLAFVATIVLTLSPIPERMRHVASLATSAIAWLYSAVAIYLLTVAGVGMIYTENTLSARDHMYANILDQFSLKQSAENQFDKVQAIMARMDSAKLVEVKDATSLTDSQRRDSIYNLLYVMKQTKDVGSLKQFLAYSDWFRKDIIRIPEDSKTILAAAALCGAPANNITAFYDRLEPKIGTDGWNKLPLHVLEFNQ